MALLDIIAKGTTDYSATIRIVDSTDGTPETAVEHNTPGIDLWYRRGSDTTQSAKSPITEVALAALTTAHSDGGIEHIGDGYYRLDLPDGAVASGAQWCDVGGTVTDMIVMGGRILLTATDHQDNTRFGITALPDAAADAAGGLPISIAGSLDLDTLDSNVSDILTDTGTAGVVVATNNDKTGYGLSAAAVDAVWNESAADHVSVGSVGASLYMIRSNTCQAGGTSTSVKLDVSASATDDEYNGQHIYIVSGTGAGQGSVISDYTGSTTTADIADTWNTSTDATSVYVIRPFGSIPGATAPDAPTVAAAVWDRAFASHATEASFGSLFQPAQVGQAQAGGASAITLDATGASATTDFYKYCFVKMISGNSAGQNRQISFYNGGTNVATVSLPWEVEPVVGDSYIITNDFGIDAATTAAVADAVWDEARSEHQVSTTFGGSVNADVLKISGNSAAADALEAATTGAAPLPSNVTQWLGTAAATPTTAGVPEVDVTFVGGVAEDIATATALTTMQGNVTDILTDTGTTIPGLLGTPVADLATDIAGVKAVADAIEVDTQNIQSRIPTALNNGVMQSDIQRINDVEIIGDGSTTPYTV